MITPPYPDPPRTGTLATPTEEQLAAAYRRLRDEALTLPWAAERMGIDVARVEALVRAGELLAIPGPWPMRQAHRSGLGCFLPGWQFDDGRPRSALSSVLGAAAAVGWTSLDLHLFMTTPLHGSGETPARLFRAGKVDRVLALIHGEPDRRACAPALASRPRRLRVIPRPHPHRGRVAA